MTLSDLVISGSVPLIDRREWENLTGKEADELIRSTIISVRAAGQE
jgi:hypothetical protein